jgi:uncharacterized protein (TIGR03000 family)
MRVKYSAQLTKAENFGTFPSEEKYSMINLVMALALTTPGQFPCEEIQALINDRIMYGGYGTYGGCPATPSGCRPYARYAGASYGPAIMHVPFTYTIASCDSHRDDHDALHHRMDDLKCSVDKLTNCLIHLEKRVGAHEKATQAGFHATDAKIKCLDDHLKALQKKQKQGLKKLENKLDQRIKPLEEKSKATDEKIKSIEEKGKSTEDALRNLTKKLEDEARAAEIKALEDKIKRLEEAEKFKKFQDKTDLFDRIKALEGRNLQSDRSESDRKRDEALLQAIDQKLERLQGSLRKDIDGVQDHLKRIDGQLQEEKTSRQRLEERMKVLEKRPAPPKLPPPPPPPVLNPPPPPAKDNKENLREPRDLKEADPKEGKTGAQPELQATKVSQVRLDVPANKALIVVSLPADARLYLNGVLTQSRGAVRTFFTPEIQTAAAFSYTVRVEWAQQAELISQTREVTFQGGQEIRVSFGPQGNAVQIVQAR